MLSSDKDFIQLHAYDNVEQFSPVLKKFLRHEDPEMYLKEHIIKGDRGDGIPNINSPDGVFVDGVIQKPIRRNTIESVANLNIEVIEHYDAFIKKEMKRNWLRNRQLIDLSLIPDNIKSQILEEYTNYKINDRSKLFNFFIEKKLSNLMESIGEF